MAAPPDAYGSSDPFGQGSVATDFFTTSSLTLTLTASTSEPFIYDIGGRRFMLTSDKEGTATDDANNFWWIDDTETLGRSALPCHYQTTAPSSPATDQHWFDISIAQMLRWTGSAWAAVNRVFIGYTRADSGSQNAQHICEPLGATPWWRWQNFGGAPTGLLDLSSGTTTVDGGAAYAAVVLRGTAVVVHTGANATPTQFRVQGPFIMLGSSAITLDGLGRAAGAGGTGAGGAGSMSGMGGGGGGGGGGSSGAGGSGGGRALSVTHGSSNVAAGGAVGAAGSSAAAASLSISPMPNAMSLMWTHGAGGGGGGGSGAAAGGAGGAGGGGVIIAAASLAMASGTSITAKGINGTAGAGAGRGGGAGGGGGAVFCFARSLDLNGTTSATAGTGGAAGGGTSGAGGNGGGGILVFTRI